MFWKIFSPENILPNILPSPPPLVCISMLGDIQTIEPLSVIMLSPASSSQVTTAMGSPSILYFIPISSYISGAQRLPIL